MQDSLVDREIGSWFQVNRESYEWPKCSGRVQSERTIDSMELRVRRAIREHNYESLHNLLVEIHRWKTGNQRGLSTKYCGTLSSLGRSYMEELLQLGQGFKGTEHLHDVIEHLRQEYCNLPICTAIASFLYARQQVPIIDKFLSQFFAKRFKVQYVDGQTGKVLKCISSISFKIHDGGGGRLRLDVYSIPAFNSNLRSYTEEFVPECEHIADRLRSGMFSYSTIDASVKVFTAVDVEMSIFSWAVKHSELF